MLVFIYIYYRTVQMVCWCMCVWVTSRVCSSKRLIYLLYCGGNGLRIEMDPTETTHACRIVLLNQRHHHRLQYTPSPVTLSRLNIESKWLSICSLGGCGWGRNVHVTKIELMENNPVLNICFHSSGTVLVETYGFVIQHRHTTTHQYFSFTLMRS